MARRSAPRSAVPRSFRRTKAFVVVNLLVWAGLGFWYFLQPAERQADVARLVRNAFDSRKDVTAFDVAWDLWQVYASPDFVPGLGAGDNTHLYGGPPATTQPARVLVNTGYVVGYSDALGLPLWAAYRADDGDFGDAPPRPESFAVDMRTTARIEPGDYTRSGYDRGHLAPNHAIALRHGRRGQEETFLMSNIAPQRHALNAGPWEAIERRIAAKYPARFGEVWVIAGPVLGLNPEKLRGRVAVPEAYFMIIVDEAEGRVRAQAFLLPQDAPESASPAEYLTTIDEIERRTGLDLLAGLPDDVESVLESRRVARLW
ncbi:MAG: DNA/RNA non-specific endonuclease [Opitutaceae bacterium]|nr:DNA/RNA non-specific endonuclease [Opitutaceae bacterium]